MENIRDWCISRQLWWGHRIPVWYCDDCGELTVADATTPTSAASTAARPDIEQDPDVLDTWFCSGLWPHSTLGWPDETEDLRYFYPTSVMETAYDILFFWVARMIMMGLENTGEVPFHTVYLHGLIRDEKGDKMSKTKGNVVDPLEVHRQLRHRRPALRPGHRHRARQRHAASPTSKLEAGRNFANKLWNAARFVISSLGDAVVERPQLAQREAMPLEDRWIMSRLNRTAAEVEKLLVDFQFGEAGRRLYDFLWGEFCDWYIEMAKVRLKADDRSPLPVLAHVLDASLRLLHPFMPFVTEEVWQNLRPRLPSPEAEALIVAPWPQADEGWRDEQAEGQAGLVLDIVRAVRNIRAERGVAPARFVEAYVVVAPGRRAAAEASLPIIEALARVRPLHFVDGAGGVPQEETVAAILDGAEVILPLAGLLDLEAERARLRAQVADAQAEVARLEGKLANEQFRSRAPQEVVAKEEGRLAAARARLEGLRARLRELE